MYMLMY